MSSQVVCKTETDEIIVDSIAEYNSDDAIENEEHLRVTVEDSGSEYHQTYTLAENQSGTMTITNAKATPRNGNVITVPHRLTTPSAGKTKALMENEKRMRREIANSNERRRMQSINAGFQSLRSLLPHHEGEKLSKAAILQQTAQYIIELEREKTHLLSQNSQLKRLLGQHEVGGGGGGGSINDTNVTATGAIAGPCGAIKKRKIGDVVTLQTISDSSDEGLGSMSPEPVTLINAVTGASKTVVGGGTQTAVATAFLNVSPKELSELKSKLEAERNRRTLLEDRLRQLERQIYPSSNQYIHREVIEHTDNLREEDVPMSFPLQVVEIDSLPSIGQGQVVLCHSIEDTMTADEEEVICGDLISNVREEIVVGEDEIQREFVNIPSRLQPILEAAIKAEPKVEVERINPSSTITQIKPNNNNNNTTDELRAVKNKQINSGNGRKMLITTNNTSRQNLETIVEAIRHLEGDHLFAENSDLRKSPKTFTVTSMETKPQQQQQQHQPQQQQQIHHHHQQQQQQQQHHQSHQHHHQQQQQHHHLEPKTNAQEIPLALTAASNVKQITTMAGTAITVTQPQTHHQQQRKLPIELAPFLQLKKSGNGNNTVTIVSSSDANGQTTLTVVPNNIANSNNCGSGSPSNNQISNLVTFKTQHKSPSSNSTIVTTESNTEQPTIVTTQGVPVRVTNLGQIKQQCRPGVIVAKQVS